MKFCMYIYYDNLDIYKIICINFIKKILCGLEILVLNKFLCGL